MSSLDSTHTATLEIADSIRGDTAILPKATTLLVLAWRDFKRRLWERDGGICGICREPVSQDQMQIDHVIPRSRGGAHEWANLLQAAHRVCNIRKGDGAGHRARRRLMVALNGKGSLMVANPAERSRVDEPTTPLTLRLPTTLLERLRRVADEQDRSLNAQVVRAMREWLENYQSRSSAADETNS
jgi:hypothetical protein